MTTAEYIRLHTIKRHIAPTRAAGREEVSIRLGDIRRRMGLMNPLQSVRSAAPSAPRSFRMKRVLSSWRRLTRAPARTPIAISVSGRFDQTKILSKYNSPRRPRINIRDLRRGLLDSSAMPVGLKRMSARCTVGGLRTMGDLASGLGTELRG